MKLQSNPLDESLEKIITDSSKIPFTGTSLKETSFSKDIRMGRRTLYVLVLVLFLASAFYWFEIRPAKIRHDCSWRKEHIADIPAQPAKIVEGDDIWSWARSSPAIPAQPAHDEWHRVSGKEYEFCLHDRGL